MIVPDETSTRSSGPTRVARWALVGMEGFVAVGAMYGGIGLIANNALHMTDDWLIGTPFQSWTLPGVLLLLVVAVPMIVAAVAELFRLSWAYGASLLAGAAQVGWIVAQWLIMQRFFILQPVMLAAGVIVLLLAWASHRGLRSKQMSTSRPDRVGAG
jgi:hypothetical protein